LLRDAEQSVGPRLKPLGFCGLLRHAWRRALSKRDQNPSFSAASEGVPWYEQWNYGHAENWPARANFLQNLFTTETKRRRKKAELALLRVSVTRWWN